MKKIAVFMAIILWAVAIYQGIEVLNSEGEEEVIQAFHSMQMGEESSVVTSQGRYAGDYLTVEEQKLLLKTLADGLGIVDNYDLTENNNEYGRELKLFMDGKQADTTLTFITTEQPEGESNVYNVVQYLKTEIQIENSIESAFYYKDMVSLLMERYGQEIETSILVNGVYSGELSTEQKDIIVTELIEQLDAEVVAEHRQDTYVIYAYTSMMKEYKKVGEDKINLTIAVSYDEEKDSTSFILATPVLNEDF